MGTKTTRATEATEGNQRIPALLNGEAHTAAAWHAVRSPYDGRLLASVPECTESDIDLAVEVAKNRLIGPALPAHERAAILDRVAAALIDRSEDFAQTLSAEAAKPISAARIETSRAVDTLRFSAAATRSFSGEMIPMDASQAGEGRLGFTIRVPVGVVACISPFNFPLNLVCHKVAPGVAAGVPMVLKPASATPLSALKLAHLFEECGLPPGWLNVITCAGATASRLAQHPDVAMITFTGSAEVGWAIRTSAPKKRIGLELGNSSPVIVEPDADLGLAAERIVAGGFSYSGQTCISVQRVYAHKDIHDELLERVASLTAKVNVGDPGDDSTVVSSLIDSRAAQRVRDWIDQAGEGGASIVTASVVAESPDSSRLDWDSDRLKAHNIVAPTLLRDVESDMLVSCDEVFGPVIGFSSYSRLEDAIEASNGTRYGLQAGIFTTRIDTALRAASLLQFGGVIINDTSSYRTDQQPYGGVKDSGNTREGPGFAIEEMTESRTVIIRG